MIKSCSPGFFEKLDGVLENQHRVGEGPIGGVPAQATCARVMEELRSFQEGAGEGLREAIESIGTPQDVVQKSVNVPPFDNALEEGEEI